MGNPPFPRILVICLFLFVWWSVFSFHMFEPYSAFFYFFSHIIYTHRVKNAIFEYDHKRSWSPEALPYRNPCWTQGIDCGGCPNRDKLSQNLYTNESSSLVDESSLIMVGNDGKTPQRWVINNVSVDWCERETGDLSDVLTTKYALELMDIALISNKSFYLAVGYHKPHMPWIAKPKHFDLYPLDEVMITSVKTLDISVPPIAFNSNNSPSPYQAITDDQARLARRAYYAATSGMDEQVYINMNNVCF